MPRSRSLCRSLLVGLVVVACGGPGPLAEPAPKVAETSPSPPSSPPLEEPDAGASSKTVEPLDGGTDAAEEAGPPPPERVSELPRDTTVLHVGDSFAAALGIALNRQLKERGIKGVLRYQTASFIPGWANGGEIPLYIAQTKPDLVLVTLGANEVAMYDPTIRAAKVQKLVERIGDRPCVWIAPSLWGQHTGIMDVVRANCAPCRYMDTNALIKDMPRAKDGIHPSMSAREDWAKVVLEWLQQEIDPDGGKPWSLRPEPAEPKTSAP